MHFLAMTIDAHDVRLHYMVKQRRNSHHSGQLVLLKPSHRAFLGGIPPRPPGLANHNTATDTIKKIDRQEDKVILPGHLEGRKILSGSIYNSNHEPQPTA